MIRIKKHAVVAFALLAVVVAVGACGDKAPMGQAQESPADVSTIDGYGLAGDPKSAIEFSGNLLIFAGEVINADSPRKVDRTTESGDKLVYIYTPVIVKISRVFKGDQLRVGETVAIRAIGGQIGSQKVLSKIGPSPEQYQLGMKLFLLTQDIIDVGDGLPAATPNFVYAEDSAGNVYNLHEPEHKTSLSIFSAGITEWVAFNS